MRGLSILCLYIEVSTGSFATYIILYSKSRKPEILQWNYIWRLAMNQQTLIRQQHYNYNALN